MRLSQAVVVVADAILAAVEALRGTPEAYSPLAEMPSAYPNPRYLPGPGAVTIADLDERGGVSPAEPQQPGAQG